MGAQFDAIETIADLGSRISAAAGKSANLELFHASKIGRKWSYYGQCPLSLGLGVRYVGALQLSDSPVFEEFAEKTDAVSLTEPGITTHWNLRTEKSCLAIW